MWKYSSDRNWRKVLRWYITIRIIRKGMQKIPFSSNDGMSALGKAIDAMKKAEFQYLKDLVVH